MAHNDDGKISTIVDWACANWEEWDRSIWEVRGPDQDFVFSKLMCWVAIDRGLRLADLRSLPAEIYRYDWQKVQDLERQSAVPESEGTFNLCTFWLIEAMALTRRPDLVEEARVTFERMLGYANHPGLYAEQTGRAGRRWATSPRRPRTPAS